MDWKSITATALVTGIVTIITGMMLFWFQSKEPKLVYTTVESIPFESNQGRLSIFQVQVRNSGKKPAESVVLFVQLPKGEIQENQIVIDPAIKHQVVADKTSFRLEANSLNPNEASRVSLLLSNPKGDLTPPIVSLRAKDVAGVQEPSTRPEMKISAIAIALFSAYAGIFAFFLSSARNRKKFVLLFKLFRHGKSISYFAEQKHVIGSALAIFGLPEKARAYLNAPARKTYWAEAELLAAEAILETDPASRRKYLSVLRILKDRANINAESKAVVLYSMARIYQSLGEAENTKNALREAKALDSDQVEIRLNIDPMFKEQL